MNGTDFLEYMELVDPAYVEAADVPPRRRKRTWLKWGSAAACLCAAAASVFALSRFGVDAPLETVSPASPVPSVSGQPDHSNAALPPVTSDTYDTLDQLLFALSGREEHGSDGHQEANGTGVPAAAQSAGSDTVSLGGYVYQIKDGGVEISQDGVSASRLDVPAEKLFLVGERLIVAGREAPPEPEGDVRTCVELFDLAAPEKPVSLAQVIQSGELTACWLSGGRLYLMSSDGMCACGFSRLADTQDYVPALSRDGEAVSWTVEEICILGEPTRVSYTAVTVLSADSLEIEAKCACYGDIDSVFYGEDWFAFATESRTSDRYVLPELYAFDAPGLAFLGRVDTAAVFGLEKTRTLADYVLPDGDYPAVKSVFRAGKEWRVVGEYRTVSPDDARSVRLFALTFHPEDGAVQTALLELPESRFAVDDVLWEAERAVISTGTSQEGVDNARIVFAEFGADGVAFYQNGLVCDRVMGIDKLYWLGTPLGSIRPFIPMGNGVYLRYRGTPDGLDVYDFSDSANPRRLYQSDGDIPEGCRLDFEYRIYDERTVAVRLITPNEGEYRNVSYSWLVFSVDPEAEVPLTVVEECREP